MDVNKANKLRKMKLLLMTYQAYINFLNVVHTTQIRKRQMWTRFIFSENERRLHGFFSKLFLHIKKDDPDQFRQATRMSKSQFMFLNSLLENRISKQHVVRAPISAECRLAITLVYLAHGVPRKILSWSFRVGVSTIGRIIIETCDAIWDELHEIYLSPPNKTEWQTIADQFYEKTGMPHVLSAIDGKHVAIKCPPKSGSLYYNYKKYFSVVLLAACDSNYTFTAVDIGAYGSQSDGGILERSGFGQKILNRSIDVPSPIELPNSDIVMPYFFIGDSAFPLKENIMRPYPGRVLEQGKACFNKILSRARVRIENTFGILVAKWRVLTNTINAEPKNAEKIVKATVVLHNFVKFHEQSSYIPQNFTDHFSESGELIEGTWRQEVRPMQQSRLFRRYNFSRNAFSIRDTLKNYLSPVTE